MAITIKPKTKRFLYKEAGFLSQTGDSAVTLESLLRKALKKVNIVLDRSHVVGDTLTETRLINYHSTSKNEVGDTQILGCEVLAFEKGNQPAFVQLAAEAEELNLEALPVEKGKELVKGSAYLGICNNHVVVIQSRDVNLKDLEDYLNWFLVAKAEVLGEKNLISLNDCPPRRKIKGVKSISFQAPLAIVPATESPSKAADRSVLKQEEKSFLTKLTGPGFEALKAALKGTFDLGSDLSVDDLMKVPEIDVKLSLVWKPHKREDDSDFMTSIARHMRHLDTPFEIHTKSGKITNADFMIQQAKSVRWGELRPDWGDLFPKMAEWLAYLIRSDSIRT